MTRQCRLDGCINEARTGRRICGMHRQRIWRHGDPHHDEWSVADEHDVETIIREARAVEGLTRLERVMVARGLTARHIPADEIARIVGVTPRTVWRWKADGFRQAA